MSQELSGRPLSPSFEELVTSLHPVPSDVPMAVALIAETPPAALQGATVQVRHEHLNAAFDAPYYAQVAKIYSGGVGDVVRITEERAEKPIAEAQARLAGQQSRGGGVSAEDLELVLAADQLRTHLREGVQPLLDVALDELGEAIANRDQAVARERQLKPLAVLAVDVENNINKLSRRGRVKSAIAGLLLGAGLSLGFAATLNETAPKTVAELGSIKDEVAISVTGLATSLGLACGVAFGTKQTRQFAHRRAKRLVRNTGAQL